MILLYRFLPLVGAARNFSIIAFGDWGWDGRDSGLRETMEQIKKLGVSNFFLLGDNFYPSGIKLGLKDPQFDLFRKIVRLPGASYYAVLGNHDYEGDVAAQIEFSRIDSQWILPAKYYARMFQFGTVRLCAVFIDTETLYQGDEPQLEWIRRTLGQCQSPGVWRVVVGHRNVISAGQYNTNTKIKNILQPTLNEFGVHVYLSGHEHNLQTLVEGSTVYAVSGRISQTHKSHDYSHPSVKWFAHGVVGFAQLSINGNSLQIDMKKSSDGSIMHTTIIRRRGSK
jgi:tartrate-resistant acid phosphatase type 5